MGGFLQMPIGGLVDANMQYGIKSAKDGENNGKNDDNISAERGNFALILKIHWILERVVVEINCVTPLGSRQKHAGTT